MEKSLTYKLQLAHCFFQIPKRKQSILHPMPKYLGNRTIQLKSGKEPTSQPRHDSVVCIFLQDLGYHDHQMREIQ